MITKYKIKEDYFDVDSKSSFNSIFSMITEYKIVRYILVH